MRNRQYDDTGVTRSRVVRTALRRAMAGLPAAALLVGLVLPGSALAGTNGQRVIVNGTQKSVLLCGTNQRGTNICEPFNTLSTSTADPNRWWWVGTVSIEGWSGPNETGNFLGKVYCTVPKSQSGGDWVTCNTGW